MSSIQCVNLSKIPSCLNEEVSSQRMFEKMAKEFAKKLYASAAWRKCREGYIGSVNGLCERCLAKGKITAGKICHHKVWLTPDNINDPSITLNWELLEYLCQDCHNNEHHGSHEGVTRDDVMFNECGELVPVEEE